uniref:SDG915 n=1 Tax=Arundo donax TaxID=35708 RepID=A0A0A9GQ85_ARUDO
MHPPLTQTTRGPSSLSSLGQVTYLTCPRRGAWPATLAIAPPPMCFSSL